MWADASARGAAERRDPTAALRQRIEILEEENRQLRELLAPNIALPREWQLPPQARRFLISLRSAAPGYLSYERGLVALYGLGDEPDSAQRVLQQRASVVRRRFRAISVPIEVRIVWAQGYLMPPESVAVFDRLTAQAAS